MKVTCAALFLALFATCASETDDPAIQALLKKTRLSQRITVSQALPIDPGSTLLSLGSDGKVFHNGVESALEELPLPPEEWGDNPILFEVGPDTRMEEFYPLLEETLRHSFNVSFLAKTGTTHRAVVLPLMVDTSTFPVQHGAERTYPNKGLPKRLWIHVRVGEEGTLHVRTLIHGYGKDVVEDPVYVPPETAPVDKAPLRTPWKGDHPKFGPWDPATFTKLFSREDVKALSPYVRLEVLRTDRAGDVVRALSTLRATVGMDFGADLYPGDPVFVLLERLKDLLGIPVEEAVRKLGLDLRGDPVVDEPPGVARAIEGTTDEGVEVHLYVNRIDEDIEALPVKHLPRIMKMNTIGVAVRERGRWKTEGAVIERFHRNP